MKALILYKDWLLLNRGEIRPEIGDNIILFKYGKKYYTSVHKDNYSNENGLLYKGNYIYHSPKNKKEIWWNIHYEKIDDCYVEIDYNSNDAIEFAEWLRNNINHQNGIDWTFEGNWVTTKELYKQFKEEQNDKRRTTSTD